MARHVVIKGGKRELTTDYLEAVSDQILRARMGRAGNVEISLDVFQRVLNELIQRRHQEMEESSELEEIISQMEEDGPLVLDEDGLGLEGCFDYSGFEITDLSQLGEDFDDEDLEELEEIDEDDLLLEPIARVRPLTHRRRYWVPALNYYRVLAISLLGFSLLALIFLLEG